jgi:hypothetical protein
MGWGTNSGCSISGVPSHKWAIGQAFGRGTPLALTKNNRARSTPPWNGTIPSSTDGRHLCLPARLYVAEQSEQYVSSQGLAP